METHQLSTVRCGVQWIKRKAMKNKNDISYVVDIEDTNILSSGNKIFS